MGMGQRGNYAAVMDALNMLTKEECALSMGQRGNCAAVMDAQTMLTKEACALGMGQRSNDAAVKDAQNLLSKEECASGMGQSAIHTMNLLHSDQSSIRLLQLKPFTTSVLLALPSEDDKVEAVSVFQKR